MAYTLHQHMEMSNVQPIQHILYLLGRHQNLLSLVPYDVKPVLKGRAGVFTGSGAPSIDWTALGETPPQTNGVFSVVEDSIYLVRNQISIDHNLAIDAGAIGDPMGNQAGMWAKTFSKDLMDKFINNNNITGNTKSVNGLRGRLAQASNYGIPSDMRVDAGGLDLRASSGSLGTATNTLLRQLDDLLSAVNTTDDYSNTIIFMNNYTKNAISHGLRTLGVGSGYATDRDVFDRHVESYRGARLVDCGFRFPLNSLSPIITNSETSTGTATTGGTQTSLFAVNFGESGLNLWMMESPDAWFVPTFSDVGIFEKITIRGSVGLIQQSPTAIGQIYNFRVR